MRLLVAALLTLVAIACKEDFESRYATFSDVQRAGAGSRSWLPRWLPEDATDIRERHNIDSNATLVAFTVPTISRVQMSGCRPGRAPRHRGSASWWPSDTELGTLEHYVCDQQIPFADGRVEVWRGGAAIDRAENRIYFWRTGG